MKITEPKTPFVRYNAETDTVEGDIPDLDLYGRYKYPNSPGASTQSPTSEEPETSSRRTSLSSNGQRPSLSNRSGSASSSRSTSFNLPDEARRGIRADRRERGEEVEEDEMMDEEAAAKHAEFVRARGRHYSNEAEAMKRAQQLMEEEDLDEDSSVADAQSDVVSMEEDADNRETHRR
ncbi:hypothetical protein PUNSTDRAFT_119712 [Punctularia strigosozonata HHB-11173 SS5]|uniref:uncharacterized protein n=1 Tax=Punctularia strigosozonata (strain HHB-11173) TaxID=741275 RepID=UPI0004417EFF|nr:uncharacterized protein PUNSTDRAFT_119712 [Punctularia strigosozonata HHB-11173 SS5]EIN10846.1 hypothetical protein PUNSTDRAFT_119712 [Punctularia strigosozonata HHB-11173 SS5]